MTKSPFCDGLYTFGVMASRYPIILAHGIVIKDYKFFRAFGRIEKTLKNAGYDVYTSRTDGFGSIENNAAQLKCQIEEICKARGVDKVNIIAHSKGGLDAKYMIDELDGDTRVASLTTVCSPHKGSKLAGKICGYPKPLLKFIAFWIDFWYKIFGDKAPDSMRVLQQLKAIPPEEYNEAVACEKVYCQSFSAVMKRSRDDFVMGIPLKITNHTEDSPTDGIVSVESSKFGNYRGNCLDGSVSHSEIIDFMAGKKKRQKVFAFYLSVCEDLANRGF